MDDDADIIKEIQCLASNDIKIRCNLIDGEIRGMNSELARMTHELNNMNDRIAENAEKMKLNRQLPYLVGNVVEVINEKNFNIYNTRH